MDAEIDLKGILGSIRRQLWLILSTIAAILILTIIFTYSLTPKYTATSLVLVDTSTKNLLDSDNIISNPSADNSRVESEVGILKSDRILLNVVSENNLVSDSEFGIEVSLKEQNPEAGYASRFSRHPPVKRPFHASSTPSNQP